MKERGSNKYILFENTLINKIDEIPIKIIEVIQILLQKIMDMNMLVK